MLQAFVQYLSSPEPHIHRTGLNTKSHSQLPVRFLGLEESHLPCSAELTSPRTADCRGRTPDSPRAYIGRFRKPGMDERGDDPVDTVLEDVVPDRTVETV